MRSLAAIGRVGAAAILLASALFTSQLTVPSVAVACSCRMPGGVAEVVGDPDIVVVAGTIAAVEIANGPFGPQRAVQLTVLRVFQGEVLPGPVPIRSGHGSDCIPMLEGGSHVVLTARIGETGLEPVICGHFGLLTTVEGQALLREVEAAFGPGTGPPAPAPASGVDLASIALIAVGGLVAVVLFGTIFLAFGRRDRAAA